LFFIREGINFLADYKITEVIFVVFDNNTIHNKLVIIMSLKTIIVQSDLFIEDLLFIIFFDSIHNQFHKVNPIDNVYLPF
jgi:hypothetical protein